MSVGDIAIEIVGDAQNNIEGELDTIDGLGTEVGASDVLEATININNETNTSALGTSAVGKDQEITGKALQLAAR